MTKHIVFLKLKFEEWLCRLSDCLKGKIGQRTLTIGEGSLYGCVSRLTVLDLAKQENMLSFEWTETTESKPVKQETSCIVKLPQIVSVLWMEA